MRYPEFIRDGGTLGFIAPSFGCGSLEPYHSRFQSALNYFMDLGFATVIGPNVYCECGIGKSNTPERCGEEINDFFSGERCDAVLSVGGGETMCEDLDYVDFEKLAVSKPHWFLGYSDNTNLTFTLPTLCDTAAIYGANAPSFGMKPLHPSLWDTIALMQGKKLTFASYDSWELESLTTPENPTAPLNCTMPSSMALYLGKSPVRFLAQKDKNSRITQDASNMTVTQASPFTIRGRMLGGCLDCLICLCGTKYDKVKEFNQKYQRDGVLWFLETCDLNPISILRALWQLKNAGWFETAKGFLIGRPLHYTEEMMGLTCNQAFLHALKDLNLPILLDVDLGHLPPQMPFLSGAVGNISVAGEQLSITYEFV